ncbi:MAG: hypothetical protein ABIZ34_07675 [Candidatus Limnocylindrales bacterium]
MLESKAFARMLIVFGVLALALPGSTLASTRPIGPSGVPSYQDREPDIAIDSADHVHATWLRQGDGQGVWYATNASGDWVAQQVTSGANDIGPRIGLDAADHVYIAYVRYYKDPDPGIFTSTNTSGNWVTTKFITDTNIDAGIGLAVSPTGQLHITWHGVRTGPRAFHYATNTSGSVVATELMQGDTDCAVSIALAPNGKVHVVGYKSDQGATAQDLAGLIYFTNAGGSIGTSDKNLTRVGSATFPDVTIDASGTVRILYFERAAGAPDLFGVRVLKTLTYQGYLEHDGKLSYPTGPATAAPSGDVEADGTIHAGWLQSSAFPRDVMVTVATGDDTSDRVTTQATNVGTSDKANVALAIDSAAGDHVVFGDQNTGPNIYYVTRTAPPAAQSQLQVSTSAWSSPIAIGLVAASDVSVPVHSPRLGQTVASNGSVPTQVSWFDGGAGPTPTGFELQQQTGTAAFAGVTINPGPTTANVSLQPAKSYVFRVRALYGGDPPGNWSTCPPAKLTLAQESKASYRKTWSTVNTSTASGGSTRRTSVRNATATFKFTGRTAALVAPVGANYGRAKVFVDNVLEGYVDLHASSSAARRIVWVRTWATSDPRTVKFVVEATSGHPQFEVDALLYDR